ncbi:hypothetical protein BD779DRAFT_1479221 [Infundibulicybe gibba]|nr:hypothetical protein BD779DRAFT_1479221 [Infundibulicybe gibba]
MKSGYPKAALAIATAAVERAFLAWSTGNFVKYSPNQSFTAAEWSHKTKLYLADISKLTPNAWQKIISKTRAALRERQKGVRNPPEVEVIDLSLTERGQVMDADDQ